MEPRRVGEALRVGSSTDKRASLVAGEVERGWAAAAVAESTEGEGVRSWTFLRALAKGDRLAVDAEGEGGRGTVSAACCGLREKKPKTFIVLCWRVHGQGG